MLRPSITMTYENDIGREVDVDVNNIQIVIDEGRYKIAYVSSGTIYFILPERVVNLKMGGKAHWCPWCDQNIEGQRPCGEPEPIVDVEKDIPVPGEQLKEKVALASVGVDKETLVNRMSKLDAGDSEEGYTGMMDDETEKEQIINQKPETDESDPQYEGSGDDS